MRVRYHVVFLVSFSINSYGVSSDFHAKGHQRRTEAHIRKQEEPTLALLIRENNFAQAVQVYCNSARLPYKNKTVIAQLESKLVCLAAYFGDMSIVSLLLDRDLPVDQRDPLGNTPLIWAAHIGNHELVSFLLEHGAQVDAHNKAGLTALDVAFRLKHGRVASALVQAYMEQESEKNWKPVPWCMHNGYKELARLLIETPLVSVPVDDVDGQGNSGLLWAVRNNDRNGVKLLLAKGASVLRGNFEGVSPLSLALQSNDSELVALFAEQAAKQEERNNSRYGALTWAVRRGDVYIVRKLLRLETNDIQVHDQLGNTPLMWAVIEGHHTIARMLLRAGANAVVQNKLGKSPIAIAAQKGDAAMLTLLSQSKKVFKERNQFGWTPLITAARYGQYDAVQLLLEHGVSVDDKDSDGSTALYWAARFGHDTIVLLLLKGGAAVNEKNEFGWTPLYWAAKNKHARVVRLLLEYGAIVDKDTDYGVFVSYCKYTYAIKTLFTKENAKI